MRQNNPTHHPISIREIKMARPAECSGKGVKNSLWGYKMLSAH